MYDPSLAESYDPTDMPKNVAAVIASDKNNSKAPSIVGKFSATTKDACRSLLMLLKGRAWCSAYMSEWPSSIHDLDGMFKSKWLTFNSLQELDLELTLRGYGHG